MNVLAAVAIAATLGCGTASAAWPERPVTLIVPWGAGGGTDVTARIVGSLLEKELGQPVTVVNRTGGSGVVGHAAISSAPPDGDTIGLMPWQGLTDISGASYTPIGLSTSILPGCRFAPTRRTRTPTSWSR